MRSSNYCSQYKSFINDELKRFQAKLNDYSQKHRLDKFYFDVIGIKKYEEMLLFLKLLLILCHSHATVEQGFSNDNNLVKSNTNPGIVIAKREGQFISSRRKKETSFE